MIVFDTDTFTHFVRGNPNVVARVEQSSERFSLTVVSQIETLRGRFDAVMKAENAERLKLAQSLLLGAFRDLAKQSIVPFDDESLESFESLRVNKSLRKIGRADLLIASIALAHSATLVTRNLKHFRQVPGLRLENWAD